MLPDCGEATFVGAVMGGVRRDAEPGRPTIDPLRARQEAERRARTKTRRYCTANKLFRMSTLTYRGDGQHDYRQMCEDVRRFMVRLRNTQWRGKAFPYLWVAELHPGGHGWHVHLLLPRYVLKERLAEIWGHGFVDPIKISTKGNEAAACRVAASYVAKYVSKAYETVPNRNRYKCAEGYQPREEVESVQAIGAVAIAHVSEFYFNGAKPVRIWSSSELPEEDWRGPPIMVAFYG